MRTILFICEHGSAKSVVAAAHFNKLAAERGLAFHAISRGTDPDPANHPAAVSGLRDDHLEPQASPLRLSANDLQEAARVIAFSALPPAYQSRVPVTIWTVPPISEDYPTSRGAIVTHLDRLLRDLAQQA